MKPRRIHRKKFSSKRREAWTPKPLQQHQDPKIVPPIKMLFDVPKKCPKCGCQFVREFKEIGSSIRMAHCQGALGGCGKTWRLESTSTRLLPEA